MKTISNYGNMIIYGKAIDLIMKPPKPQMDLLRPLSWSSLSCFANPDKPEYSSPEKWYRRYVLSEKEPQSKELAFGSMIDQKIQNDPKFLPELERFPVMQFKMQAAYKGIPMLGFADHWHAKNRRLKDDKTGRTPWDKKRADKTGQLTMYAALIWLMLGIDPSSIDFQIDWMPTVQNADLSVMFAKPFALQSFYTQRKRSDVLKFLNYVEKTYKAMIAYDKKMADLLVYSQEKRRWILP